MIFKLCKKIIDTIIGVFINGLLTLLPITITIGIFTFLFNLIQRWLAPLQALKIPYLDNIPHGEFFVLLGIIFFSGLVLKSFVMRSILDLFEIIVSSVPIIRPVYNGVKQLVHAFSPSDTDTFKQVVLVEFPRKGVYSIGFLTSELKKELSPNQDETFYNIFVPTTPNPTTGYFVVFSKGNFTPVDLTTEEAMALIISGGIIQPKRFK
jgi:uncharacterized membrane protein